jgi:hypothetical protein
MFLAITGCIVALWVFTQTYFQPSRNVQLDITSITGGVKKAPSSQPSSVYQGESTTNARPVTYGASSRRTSSPRTSPVNGAAAGGGSLRQGTQSTRNPSARNTPGISISGSQQPGVQNRGTSLDSGNPSRAESTSSQPSSAARPNNVGGFSTPPAGQSLGMEQAKRTPSDSSSDRNYVPFRSSMANRPN